MNRLTIIFLCIVVGLGAFGLGAFVGYAIPSEEVLAPMSSPSELSQAIAELGPGDAMELVIAEEATGSYARTEGGRFTLSTPDRAYWRGMSWFGEGAVSGATKAQGLEDLRRNGTFIGSAGANYGTGVLESFWGWLVDVFWTVAFLGGGVLLVLVVLAFVPATSSFARGALRFLAGIIPWLGSVVENTVGRKKEARKEKQVRQVVGGGERFLGRTLPETLAQLPLEAETRELVSRAVRRAFLDAHRAVQDADTRESVEKARQNV